MRKTMAGVMFLVCVTAAAACDVPADGEQLTADDELGEETASRPEPPDAPLGLRPFHSAVFDHAPSEEELDLELDSFLSTLEPSALGGISNLIYPTDLLSPEPGQKVVRLAVKTSDIKNAGTDHADEVSFIGTWRVDGTHYTESFILDDPNDNDLNRDSLSVYFYVLNLNTYVEGAKKDVFVKGKIANTSKDAWHCHQVLIHETNHALVERVQSLFFNQWIERSESGWMFGNSTQTLYY